jgi:uncharacterized protein (TIGR02466 family)
MKLQHKIKSVFPSCLYITHKKTPLSSSELEDIKKEYSSRNSYIFNTNSLLTNLKEFCEEHINIYVNEVIHPKEKLDFYITQSWINITLPGGNLINHSHRNSIISGIFCVSAVKNDKIFFCDPYWKFKNSVEIEPEESSLWNSRLLSIDVIDNKLLLFPSWLEHEVLQNKTNTSRISLAFNVFAKGIFGATNRKNELILS